MNYYVTLFDSYYLTRGLVLYRSLRRYAGEFHLWVICFDDLAYTLLQTLRLEHVTLIPLSRFEDEDLLRVKPQRTHQEYCWTATPSVMLYVLDTAPQVEAITYLDADLMFFSSLQPIFDEVGSASILLTEHRYLPQFASAIANGIYNVQFVMCRRDATGLKALQWWRERCLEWCFARNEENRYGDQKYLDDWSQRFRQVHNLRHLGAGLAPWNATQYTLSKRGGLIYVEQDPLIFYHFHHLRLYPGKIAYVFDHYPINRKLRQWIYQPYLQEVRAAEQMVQTIEPQFRRGIVNFSVRPQSLEHLYKMVKSTVHALLQGRYCRYK